jgi:hypothetical protein
MEPKQICPLGRYSPVIVVIAIAANIILFIYLLNTKSDMLSADFGIKSISRGNCANFSFALANSIYIIYYYISFIVFSAVIIAFFLVARFSIKNALIILALHIMVLTPFVGIVGDQQVFMYEHALSRACANPFNSMGVLINILLLPTCMYIVLWMTELFLTGYIRRWRSRD